MPLAWLLQSLLLFHRCGSSGSAVRASRYAHYTPPRPLVLQVHSLQRCGLQDYLASSSITYVLMHCLGFKPTIYERMHRNLSFGYKTRSNQKSDSGQPWKVPKHEVQSKIESIVQSRVQSPGFLPTCLQNQKWTSHNYCHSSLSATREATLWLKQPTCFCSEYSHKCISNRVN